MAFAEIVNLSSQVTNIEEYLNNKTTALVSPKTSPGISGFVFDIPLSESITLASEITDNFTESNSFIQDQRIKKPIQITLTGLIGELVIKKELADLILQTIQNKLSTVDAYLGDYTDGVTQIIQTVVSQATARISQLTQIANRIKNIVEGFDGEGQYRNLQQRAYSNLNALFQADTLVSVQTPWQYFDQMHLETVEFSQDEETETITNISVTLKEARFAEVTFTSFERQITAPRNQIQKETTKSTGKVRGERNSLLFDISSAVKGAF